MSGSVRAGVPCNAGVSPALWRAGRPRYNQRRGFTLIELLVAMVLTLLLMGTVVTLFDNLGRGVAGSRSGLEAGEQLQSARGRLQADLDWVTCPVTPWLRSESAPGVFEYFEGPLHDQSAYTLPSGSLVPAALGDYDDILAFTARSRDVPFTGRFGFDNNGVPIIISSSEAEIIWYAIENPNVADTDPTYRGEPGMRTVYRRVFLIAPQFSLPASAHALSAVDFYQQYDLSVRRISNQWVPNTLADLPNRANRTAHVGGSASDPELIVINPALTLLGGIRQGEDIMLRNVLAFDVRAFDPMAQLKSSGSGREREAVGPSDPGWSGATDIPANQGGLGAFVDLQYGSYNNPPSASWFSGASASVPRTWDTWPFQYEHDGIDQDDGGSGRTDEGTNGFDDDGDGFVDESDEMETSPPYLNPLRGIQVRMRVYEPSGRQIREVSVVGNFVGD